MGLSDIGFCVFSLGSIRICVGLMFWIRVEFVVVQVDYYVCGVRLLSSLVSGF